MTLKTLILCMALVKAGAGQSIYPMLSINERGDTLCTVTMPQLQQINIQLVGLEQCNEFSEDLLAKLNASESISEERKVQVSDLRKLLLNRDSVVSNNAQIFLLKEKIISGLETDRGILLRNEKKLKRNIFVLKIAGIGVTTSLLILLLSN